MFNSLKVHVYEKRAKIYYSQHAMVAAAICLKKAAAFRPAPNMEQIKARLAVLDTLIKVVDDRRVKSLYLERAFIKASLGQTRECAWDLNRSARPYSRSFV